MPDVTTLTQYVNYGLLIIIALGVIGGFVKGLWHSLFHFIFIVGMALIIWANFDSIMVFLMGIDLSAYYSGFTGYGITTLESFPSVIINNLPAMVADSPEVEYLVAQLFYAIFALVIYLFLLLIVVMMLRPLEWILYHLIFKRFIPKVIRRKLKLRLAGAGVGGITMLLVVSVLMAPLSTLSNIGAQIDRENSFDPTMTLVLDYSQIYSETFIAKFMKMFQNETMPNGFDQYIMDQVLEMNFDGVGVSLNQELTIFADVFNQVMSSGLLDGNTLVALTDLSMDTAEAIITRLNESQMVQTILTVAISLAVDFAQEEFPEYLTGVDFTFIDGIEDWGSEILSLFQLFQSFIDEEGHIMTNFDAILADSTLLAQIGTTINNSEMLREVLPSVLSSFLQSTDMQATFDEFGIDPTVLNFADLDWSVELVTLGEAYSLLEAGMDSISIVTARPLVERMLSSAIIEDAVPSLLSGVVTSVTGELPVEFQNVLTLDQATFQRIQDEDRWLVELDIIEELNSVLVRRMGGDLSSLTTILTQPDATYLLEELFGTMQQSYLLEGSVPYLMDMIEDTLQGDSTPLADEEWVWTTQQVNEEIRILTQLIRVLQRYNLTSTDALSTLISQDDEGMFRPDIGSIIKDAFPLLLKSHLFGDMVKDTITSSIEDMLGASGLTLTDDDWDQEVKVLAKALDLMNEYSINITNLAGIVNSDDSSEIVGVLLNTLIDSKLLSNQVTSSLEEALATFVVGVTPVDTSSWNSDKWHQEVDNISRMFAYVTKFMPGGLDNIPDINTFNPQAIENIFTTMLKGELTYRYVDALMCQVINSTNLTFTDTDSDPSNNTVLSITPTSDWSTVTFGTDSTNAYYTYWSNEISLMTDTFQALSSHSLSLGTLDLLHLGDAATVIYEMLNPMVQSDIFHDYSVNELMVNLSNAGFSEVLNADVSSWDIIDQDNGNHYWANEGGEVDKIADILRVFDEYPNSGLQIFNVNISLSMSNGDAVGAILDAISASELLYESLDDKIDAMFQSNDDIKNYFSAGEIHCRDYEWPVEIPNLAYIMTNMNVVANIAKSNMTVYPFLGKFKDETTAAEQELHSEAPWEEVVAKVILRLEDSKLTSDKLNELLNTELVGSNGSLDYFELTRNPADLTIPSRIEILAHADNAILDVNGIPQNFVQQQFAVIKNLYSQYQIASPGGVWDYENPAVTEILRIMRDSENKARSTSASYEIVEATYTSDGITQTYYSPNTLFKEDTLQELVKDALQSAGIDTMLTESADPQYATSRFENLNYSSLYSPALDGNGEDELHHLTSLVQIANSNLASINTLSAGTANTLEQVIMNIERIAIFDEDDDPEHVGNTYRPSAVLLSKMLGGTQASSYLDYHGMLYLANLAIETENDLTPDVRLHNSLQSLIVLQAQIDPTATLSNDAMIQALTTVRDLEISDDFSAYDDVDARRYAFLKTAHGGETGTLEMVLTDKLDEKYLIGMDTEMIYNLEDLGTGQRDEIVQLGAVLDLVPSAEFNPIDAGFDQLINDLFAAAEDTHISGHVFAIELQEFTNSIQPTAGTNRTPYAWSKATINDRHALTLIKMAHFTDGFDLSGESGFTSGFGTALSSLGEQVGGEDKYEKVLINDLLPAFLDKNNGATSVNYNAFTISTNYNVVGAQINALELEVTALNSLDTADPNYPVNRLAAMNNLATAIGNVNDPTAQEILLSANLSIEVSAAERDFIESQASGHPLLDILVVTP